MAVQTRNDTTARRSSRRPGRRSFLRRGPASGAAPFALAAMEGLSVRADAANEGLPGPRSTDNGGYGELRELVRVDPASGLEQVLRLPDGFDFSVFSTSGSPMPDGHAVPPGHGAMACFATPRPDVWRLVRNHQKGSRPGTAVPSGGAEHRYDRLGDGGTTTMTVRWDGRAPVFEHARQSLSGTIANRGGGPTPWGSWLSCERSTAGNGAGWGRDHGYVFEVPSGADGEVAPSPLRGMGRFVHEAAAVDPATGVVYETEGRDAAGCYRFVPDEPGELARGGRLQMLKVAGEWNFDTRTGQRPKRALPIEWVDIDDPDPGEAEAVPLAVFNQGWARGAAVFGRLEGCWWSDGAVYLASTSGGDEGEGQVWEYTPVGRDGGRLRLVFESPDAELLSSPDAVTVSPRGGLVLCEDSRRGPSALRGLTARGEVFGFALHEGDATWRGATFSPDGGVLFAGLSAAGNTSGPRAQEGRTVAIWGPWERGVL